MTMERNHSEQIEYDAQQHEHEMTRRVAERAHELAVLDANKEAELARIATDRAVAEAGQAFSHESQRHTRIGRRRLIFMLVGGWLGMIVITLGVAYFVDRVASNLIEYVALISVAGAIAIPSAERLVGAQAQKDNQ